MHSALSASQETEQRPECSRCSVKRMNLAEEHLHQHSKSPPSRTGLESSASRSLCTLNTHVTISKANRQSSTCFIRSGKPKALGGHASSSRAESASRLLVSKWWAGKSAKCLGSTVSKQVRSIWRDKEHVWGKSEGERCPYVLLKTEKEEISLGVWGEGSDKEV